MKFKIFVLSIAILFFAGCSSKENTINLDEKPPLQYPVKNMQKPPVKNAKGSLYTRAGTSLFADKKDLQIGDILQVNISETLTNDSSNTKSTSKANDSSLGGGVFTASGTGAGLGRLTNKLNNNVGLGFNSSSSSSFSGNVATSLSEDFVTVISVVITDIYQNGNYFIKGSKELLISGQKQAIFVSGVIRPYDISPENTVTSSQIANLKVLYKKAGDETEVLEKPWGSRFLESIWPF